MRIASSACSMAVYVCLCWYSLPSQVGSPLVVSSSGDCTSSASSVCSSGRSMHGSTCSTSLDPSFYSCFYRYVRAASRMDVSVSVSVYVSVSAAVCVHLLVRVHVRVRVRVHVRVHVCACPLFCVLPASTHVCRAHVCVCITPCLALPPTYTCITCRSKKV